MFLLKCSNYFTYNTDHQRFCFGSLSDSYNRCWP